MRATDGLRAADGSLGVTDGSMGAADDSLGVDGLFEGDCINWRITPVPVIDGYEINGLSSLFSSLLFRVEIPSNELHSLADSLLSSFSMIELIFSSDDIHSLLGGTANKGLGLATNWLSNFCCS